MRVPIKFPVGDTSTWNADYAVESSTNGRLPLEVEALLTPLDLTPDGSVLEQPRQKDLSRLRRVALGERGQIRGIAGRCFPDLVRETRLL